MRGCLTNSPGSLPARMLGLGLLAGLFAVSVFAAVPAELPGDVLELVDRVSSDLNLSAATLEATALAEKAGNAGDSRKRAVLLLLKALLEYAPRPKDDAWKATVQLAVKTDLESVSRALDHPRLRACLNRSVIEAATSALAAQRLPRKGDAPAKSGTAWAAGAVATSSPPAQANRTDPLRPVTLPTASIAARATATTPAPATASSAPVAGRAVPPSVGVSLPPAVLGPGTLVLTARVAGAKQTRGVFVLLDATRKEAMPSNGRFDLPAGPHGVAVQYGSGPWTPETKFVLAAGRETPLAIDLPLGAVALTTTLEGQATRRGVALKLDGVEIPLPPGGRLVLEPGSHKVEARQDDGAWADTTLQVVAGQLQSASIALPRPAEPEPMTPTAPPTTAAPPPPPPAPPPPPPPAECRVSRQWSLPANGRQPIKLPCAGGTYTLAMSASSEVDVYVITAAQVGAVRGWQKGTPSPVAGALAASTESASASLSFSVPAGETGYVILDNSIFPGDRSEWNKVPASGTLTVQPGP